MRDGEVVSARVRAAAAVEAGGQVLFIWLLIRAEPHIAVNAIDRLLGFRDEFGREPAQVGVQPLDQVEHGSLHLLIENGLAGLKPLAAIVARQTAKEVERLAGKARERHPN